MSRGNVWFVLVVFVLEVFLQGRASLWISLQCDINDGIKVLKLLCTKNKLNDAVYISLLM